MDDPDSHDERVDDAYADRPFQECVTYAAGDALVQVRGEGVTPDGGWPQYSASTFRILLRRGQAWSTTPWHPTRETTPGAPPIPHVALTQHPAQIAWTVHEGICCPSRSAAWMTSTDPDSGRTIIGRTWAGGVGQPCD
jgi:hypothetical protein